MTDLDDIEDKHSAGAQSIGFDYQFYYFTYLALELAHGQKIGFEVKDDVHVDRPDGSVWLFQTKHSVQINKRGENVNLTQLDTDLWKTMSIWAAMIKANPDILKKYFFHLVTNKNSVNNDFLIALKLFKENNDINEIIGSLSKLEATTESKELNGYFKLIISLGSKKLHPFFSRLTIETGLDDIITKIKNRIHGSVRNINLVDPVYEKLIANLLEAKYLDIKERKKFEITFDDFNGKFGKCFNVAFKDKPLPKRQFEIHLPENLEHQLFVRQLLDIGEIHKGSPKIVEYTTTMLQTLNNFSYWVDEEFLLPTELNEFEKDTILLWENEFRSKYRRLERQISEGLDISNIEDDLKELAVDLVDFIRRKELSIADTKLGTDFSNGHFYALSDQPKIGWHIDWKNKYLVE